MTAPSKARLAAVRRLTRRKDRLATGSFLAEGPQAVREAIGAGAAEELWHVGPREQVGEDLGLELSRLDLPSWQVEPAVLKQLTSTVTPQGMVAVCRTPVAQALPAGATLVVVCAEVRDPGNAGTVIRSADAFGADAVILTSGSVELTNPKTVRASVGSVFHLPILTDLSLPQALELVRAQGLQVWAADGGGTLLDQVEDRLAAPTAWLLGNEAWGLPPEVASQADDIVGVPMYGSAESLNLATAAAVCLYASATAQRR